MSRGPAGFLSKPELSMSCRFHATAVSPCECSIAWRLADAIGESLKPWDRTVAYTALGIDDCRDAIVLLLTCALRDGIALPAGFFTEMSAWLDKNPGVSEESVIGWLLLRAHLRQHTIAPPETTMPDLRQRVNP